MAGRVPGTPRPAWLIVLLYAVTLGIYGWYWHWTTGKEIDRFRPGTDAFPMLKWGVILNVITFVLGIILAVVFLIAIFTLVSDLEAGEEPSDEELFRAFFAIGIPAILLLVLLVPASIAALVFTYMGLWRVWKATQAEQQALGRPNPVQPGMLLGLLLGAQALNFISTPFQLIPFVGPFIGLLVGVAVIVMGILAYVFTQNGLNDIYVAHGAAPV